MFFFLLGGLTAAELRSVIELTLLTHFRLRVHFSVRSTLRQLLRIGLVKKLAGVENASTANAKFVAIPFADAVNELQKKLIATASEAFM